MPGNLQRPAGKPAQRELFAAIGPDPEERLSRHAQSEAGQATQTARPASRRDDERTAREFPGAGADDYPARFGPPAIYPGVAHQRSPLSDSMLRKRVDAVSGKHEAGIRLESRYGVLGDAKGRKPRTQLRR